MLWNPFRRLFSPGCLARLGLAVFGTFLALVMAEVLVRLVFPQPGHARYVPDPVVGFRHEPDQRVWVANEAGEYGVWFTTNAYGNPDKERSTAKSDDVYRIAFVGDSMVEAAQVPLEARVSSLLEQQLTAWVAEHVAAIQRVEVLNFGTASYGTAQEWLNYQVHVRQFQPDLVMLFFLPGNDIKNNSFELEVERSCRPELMPFFRLDEAGHLAPHNDHFYENALAQYTGSREADGWRDRLKQIRLIVLVDEVYGRFRTQLSTEETERPLLDQSNCQTATTLELFDPQVQQESAVWQEAWTLTGVIMQQFAADVAADGAQFHVVTVTGPWEVYKASRDLTLPDEVQAQHDWQLPHEMTDAMLKQLDLNYSMLYPTMRQAAEESEEHLHFIHDGHYTPAGHRLLAAELLPVAQNYLLEHEQ